MLEIDVSVDAGQIYDFPVKIQRPGQLFLSDEERKKYSFNFPFPQEFSFPSNIIYYVSRNPACPNRHFRLISTCKSLLRISRILPLKELVHYKNDDPYKWRADNRVTLILTKDFFKFWIYEKVSILTETSPIHATTLIKHIHKCSLREMEIYNQVLTYEEFQIFVSGTKFESVYFYGNVVKNNNGRSSVEFEKVFQLLCCKDLTIRLPDKDNGFGRNTTKRIIECLSSEQIPVEQNIRLWNIPQDFDFYLFSKFLLANMSDRQHSIYLAFSTKISDAYKNKLQQFVNEIIQIRGIFAHTVPMISFTGQNAEAYNEMLKMKNYPVEGILRKY